MGGLRSAWVFRVTARAIACLALALAATWTAGEAAAQNREAELRQRLTAPLPSGPLPAISEEFLLRYRIAMQLRDAGEIERVLRTWADRVNDPNPLLLLAQHLGAAGRFRESADAYRKALPHFPAGSEAAVTAGMFLVEDLVRGGQFPEAQDRLPDLVAAATRIPRPGDARQQALWHRRLAKLHLLGAQVARIPNLQHKGLEASPGLGASRAALAAARSALQASRQAGTPEADLQSWHNDITEALEANAFFEMSEGRFAIALQLAEEAARQVPASALLLRHRIHVTLGATRHASRQFEQAAADFALSLKALEGLRGPPELVAGMRAAVLSTAVMNAFAQGDLAALAALAADLRSTEGIRGDLVDTPRELALGLAAYRARRFQEAAAHFGRSREASTRLLGQVIWKTAALEQAARVRSASEPGDLRRALTNLEAVLPEAMSELRDLDLATGATPMVKQLVAAAYLDGAARAGSPATLQMEVADWILLGESQGLANDSAVRAAAARQPALLALVDRHQTMRRTLYQGGIAGQASQAAAQRSTQETELRKLEMEIHAISPDYGWLIRPQPRSRMAIQKSLARDELLVMLLPIEDKVYLFALDHAGRSVATPASATREDILGWTRSLRRSLVFPASGSPLPFDEAASGRLYQALLGPLRALLEGKTRLVVTAGGELGSLPIAALRDPARGWLVERFEIAHSAGPTALEATRRIATAPPAAGAMIGWADPEFAAAPRIAAAQRGARASLQRSSLRTQTVDYAQIPPLPETRDEVLAIAKSLGAEERDLFLGSRATRASVLAANESGTLASRRVVVFATHGLLPGEIPGLDQPALALAPARQAAPALENLLTLQDILQLRMNADWVVLSACNTALPDSGRDEALTGLSMAFFLAGTRSVLATLWAVETESAKDLTALTFKHDASSPGATRAGSLRAAMLALAKDPRYGHPVYWAPYILIGDGGR